MAYIKPGQREELIIYNGREIPASKLTEMDSALHRIVSEQRKKTTAKRSTSGQKRGRSRSTQGNQRRVVAGSNVKGRRSRSRQRKH